MENQDEKETTGTGRWLPTYLPTSALSGMDIRPYSQYPRAPESIMYYFELLQVATNRFILILEKKGKKTEFPSLQPPPAPT